MKKFLAISIILFYAAAFAGCHFQTNNSTSAQTENNVPKEVLLSLERTACYGTCPTYTLVVLNDRTVIFDAPSYFAKPGDYSSQKSLRPIVSSISESQLKQISGEIEKAGYFNLKDKYLNATEGGCPSAGTDMPTVFTSVRLNGKQKTIEHYLGCTYTSREFRSYPKELTEFENKIDEIVNTKQWLQ